MMSLSTELSSQRHKKFWLTSSNSNYVQDRFIVPNIIKTTTPCIQKTRRIISCSIILNIHVFFYQVVKWLKIYLLRWISGKSWVKTLISAYIMWCSYQLSYTKKDTIFSVIYKNIWFSNSHWPALAFCRYFIFLHESRSSHMLLINV
jgi:hypothetical protein